MLLVHLSYLWQKPQYQFFPILLAVVGYLVWSRLELLPPHLQGPRRRWFPYSLLAISLLILSVATLVFYSPWLATLSFVLSFGASVAVAFRTFSCPESLRYLATSSACFCRCRLNYDQQLVARASAFHNVRERRSSWNASTYQTLPRGRLSRCRRSGCSSKKRVAALFR